MKLRLESDSIVPPDFYIERQADAQVRRIINSMGRPGYVLVARQMGKTNLLLHTRDVMETERVVFSFVDFSNITGFNEQECFNYIIDETIESHPDIFGKATEEIDKIRSRVGYNANRMFTNEVRILLKYVDKLIFILDEIDALTRTEYSDRIFSNIRSHYFKRTNYPELKKLTYILSGVIEPKDIIKDPNISPFNIGEKIFLTDFTKAEFNSFINKLEISENKSQELLDRLYYWGNGNPRITWDLCLLLQNNEVENIEDFDRLVTDQYFKAFDCVPIDAIRERVKNDSELRDALILMYFGKQDALDEKVKNKLYLAGITEYNDNVIAIKNPILEKSLSYDWLLSLQKQDANFLNEADRNIHIEGDYKKAIANLTRKIEEGDLTPTEQDRANLLFGEALFKIYDSEKSIKYLNEITNKGDKSEYYLKASLLKGYNYVAQDDIEAALNCFDKVVNTAKEDDEIFGKAVIAKGNALINRNQSGDLESAQTLLNNLLKKSLKENKNVQDTGCCFLYLSSIEALKQNFVKAVTYLDSALTIAQENEKPVLLYHKLQFVADEKKATIAKDLFLSLKALPSKPILDSFENPLEIDQRYTCLILAELLTHYPEYDVEICLRTFLYDSKESALLMILNVLDNESNPLTEDFLKYVGNKVNSEGWDFKKEELTTLALQNIIRLKDYGLGYKVLGLMEDEVEPQLTEPEFDLIQLMTVNCLNNGKNERAHELLNFYNRQSNNNSINLRVKLFMVYYEFILLKRTKKDYDGVRKAAARVYDYLENPMYKDKYSISSKDYEVMKEAVKTFLSELVEVKEKSGLSKFHIFKINRNDVVTVEYLKDGSQKTAKFKSLSNDIKIGICDIKNVKKG